MSSHPAAEERLSALNDEFSRAIERVSARIDEALRREHELRSELAGAETARRAAQAELAQLRQLLAQVRGEVTHEEDPLAEPDELIRAAHLAGGAEAGLSGAALRSAAVLAALRRNAVGMPVHHSEWLAWLRADGHEPAGKKPEAVFLTQLGRSPVVRRANEAGYYVLDIALARDLQEHLRDLHEQLRQLPPPDQLSMLGDTRQRRHELQAEVARVERAVEEAWRTLAQEPPPGYAFEDDDGGDVIVNAWLATEPG